MYHSESLICNAGRGWFAEPIVGRDGMVLAVRIRKKRALPGKLFGYWGDGRTTAELLREQLNLIEKKKEYFLSKGILCSIEIDFERACLLIQDAEIASLAKLQPFLRLEISEDFPNLSDGKNNRLLEILSNNYILWLGDLGSGSANLKALQEKLYDGVRISSVFFNAYSKSVIWPVITKNVMRYCNFIIVADISDQSEIVSLEKEISAMQGQCFKSVPLEEIEQLDTWFDIHFK